MDDGLLPMLTAFSSIYRNVPAVLATMHKKERVIAPILRDAMGLLVTVPVGIDTDQFGTFSGEIPRAVSPIEAARAKIAAGFVAMPEARVGLASEGSFGPYPSSPFFALGREMVMMIDRSSGLELVGFDSTLDANFGHVLAHNKEVALAFAERIGFPQQGVIVLAAPGEKPAPELFVEKHIADLAALDAATVKAIAHFGGALIVTDMRAFRNPTRMEAIGRATRDLVRRFESCCPACSYPGFDVSERIPGLPCSCCRTPTRLLISEILSCKSCGYCHARPASASTTADPGQCDACNP